MELDVILVDDERLARAELRRLLKPFAHMNIVGEAENAEQAMQILSKQKVDILFLDIEMPGENGIKLAERIAAQHKCDAQIVFCTAYDEFAVDAFSLNAADYLMKPINPARLHQCLSKFQTATPDTTLLNDDFKLMVKFQDKMKIIKLSQIYRFQSIGNHAALYTTEGKAYIQSSLNKVEKRLNTNDYFRVNRSDILRFDAIETIEQNVNSSLLANLSDGEQVEISRRQSGRLKDMFGFAGF
ncbi:DNA-binding response regulator [Thalassotalea euphylliae]|uniref:DNA-binding response regulator n=1 Tax=Thalassotalea euphylliae TaxID=1655234 RepID=A0A3E0TM09_9GAMM|nr:LytTR family DNA-binding domain-containing protein [Thalassotalea euphylliae]REL25599.1 DNA-binding response regulator [Thalassotalea euphylliae]